LARPRLEPAGPGVQDRDSVLPQVTLAAIFAHRPLASRTYQFCVQLKIPQATGRDVIACRTEHYARKAGPVTGSKAHRARLAARVKHAVFEVVPVKASARGTQRHHLGVRRDVMQLHDPVDTLSDNLVVPHNEGRDRPPALVVATAAGELDSQTEVAAIMVIELCRHP